MERIGYYCWAGPSMVRMTNLKFFNPKKDIRSLMKSYDYDYLKKVKDTFSVTDFWGMYSWGFSEKTEQEDYKFLLDRLDNFKKLDIKLHAYIQGPNLVYKEFPNVDWFCEDEKGRPITYYKGRRVTCINNPGFIEFKSKQIEKMLGNGFDGIYMDNIQMGQMPIPTNKGELPFTFAGCNCFYCNAKFKAKTGFDIPTRINPPKDIEKAYLKFRVDCVTEFLEKMAAIVHKDNLEFGSNSFDPKFNTKEIFGTDLKELDRIQDYILFENHSLPSNMKNNLYINDLCSKLTKPVFVVSYKNGIGKDGGFTQENIDNIYTEDQNCKFYSVIKGCEYCTDGKWHNLYIEDYKKPQFNSELDLKHIRVKKGYNNFLLRNPLVRRILRKYYNRFYTLFMESKTFRLIFVRLYQNIV